MLCPLLIIPIPVEVECGGVTCPLYYSCRGRDQSVCFPDCDMYNGGCRADEECYIDFYGDEPSLANHYIACIQPPYG